MLKLMYITNNPGVAQIAEKYGVDRIWIDLETLGKEERQPGNTVKSHHTVEDIRIIKPLLSTSEMLVRINPINPESDAEIDAVIDAGADIIMLPMWKTPEDVKYFVDKVAGKCKTTLLLETAEARECLDQVLEQGGFDEIHIGLNDLHMAYGQTFMFELLADGTVESIIEQIKRYGIPYGFGGVGKIGEGMLKADNIVTEHYRLGSTRVILSRAFCNTTEITDIREIEKIFAENVSNLRKYESEVASVATEKQFEENRQSTIDMVADVVAAIQAKRGR